MEEEIVTAFQSFYVWKQLQKTKIIKKSFNLNGYNIAKYGFSYLKKLYVRPGEIVQRAE